MKVESSGGAWNSRSPTREASGFLGFVDAGVARKLLDPPSEFELHRPERVANLRDLSDLNKHPYYPILMFMMYLPQQVRVAVSWQTVAGVESRYDGLAGRRRGQFEPEARSLRETFNVEL